jgi:hypothetical protein
LFQASPPLSAIPYMRLPGDLCRPGATLVPRPELVARFEPEWNSLGPNKTRSFNILGILGGIRDIRCTDSLHSPRLKGPLHANLRR